MPGWDAHKHAPSHSNTSIKKTHGCYPYYKELQFTLKIQQISVVIKIQQISVVIKRHGTVINTIYKHHPLLGVYEIKIPSSIYRKL